MTNSKLANDYKIRAKGRLIAVDALYKAALFADVVRECQESCELALKAIIREAGHSVPFTHDVSAVLREIKGDLPQKVQDQLERLCHISKQMRRDRELSFYGSEDITPSEFYTKADADEAMSQLKEVLAIL